MEERDYRLVLVGNTRVGLIGLQEVFEELKSQREKPGSVLKEMLVERAARGNYIPDSINEEYKKALFREFKKFLSEKVEDEKREFFEVIILGTGCFSCNQMEKDIINGKVKSSGTVPSKSMIKKWLEEEQE